MGTWPTKVFFMQEKRVLNLKKVHQPGNALAKYQGWQIFLSRTPCDHVNLLVLFPLPSCSKWFLGFRLGEGIEALSEKSELVQALRKASSVGNHAVWASMGAAATRTRQENPLSSRYISITSTMIMFIIVMFIYNYHYDVLYTYKLYIYMYNVYIYIHIYIYIHRSVLYVMI